MWRAVYMLCAATLVITWNVRRFDVCNVDPHAEAAKSGVRDELGRSVKKSKVITATPERSEVMPYGNPDRQGWTRDVA